MDEVLDLARSKAYLFLCEAKKAQLGVVTRFLNEVAVGIDGNLQLVASEPDEGRVDELPEHVMVFPTRNRRASI
jgi:hypothetical protein